MNNGNSPSGGSSKDQKIDPLVPLESEDPSPSVVQMKTPNSQQEPHQEGANVTVTTQNVAQPMESQSNYATPSIPETNVTKSQQQEHQLHTDNQHKENRAGNLPSAVPQHQQISVQTQQQHPKIQPLLPEEPKNDTVVDIMPSQHEQESPQKTTITKVKISDELNIFDWFRATDIMHQIAEKAKSSVDSVITTLDPGMREYLYSGGNINIVVISDHQRLVSPIRDSFQDVFGRATVAAARYNPPRTIVDYPIRTASGFAEAVQVATEKIKKLRSDTSSIPQNQVVIVVQPALVRIQNDNQSGDRSNELAQHEWFLTYCMLIEDPVLGVSLKTFSQLIPMDQDAIDSAKASTYPEGFKDRHLGYSASIDEVMALRLRLSLEDMVGDEQGSRWLPKWAGVCETHVIRQVGLTLANSYRRRWNECAHIEPVIS